MLLLNLRPFKGAYFHMLMFLLNKRQFSVEGCWFGIREAVAISSLHFHTSSSNSVMKTLYSFYETLKKISVQSGYSDLP